MSTAPREPSAERRIFHTGSKNRIDPQCSRRVTTPADRSWAGLKIDDDSCSGSVFADFNPFQNKAAPRFVFGDVGNFIPPPTPIWQSPALENRRSSSSNSSSRPTKGVSLVSCCASKRLSTELARSAAQARTGPVMPLRSLDPRSSSSKRLPTSRRVPSAMTTVFGSAIPCSRAARFGVSPTMPRSCASPVIVAPREKALYRPEHYARPPDSAMNVAVRGRMISDFGKLAGLRIDLYRPRMLLHDDVVSRRAVSGEARRSGVGPN